MTSSDTVYYVVVICLNSAPLDTVHAACVWQRGADSHGQETKKTPEPISGCHAEQKEMIYRRHSRSVCSNSLSCSFTYFCLVADERPLSLSGALLISLCHSNGRRGSLHSTQLVCTQWIPKPHHYSLKTLDSSLTLLESAQSCWMDGLWMHKWSRVIVCFYIRCVFICFVGELLKALEQANRAALSASEGLSLYLSSYLSLGLFKTENIFDYII